MSLSKVRDAKAVRESGFGGIFIVFFIGIAALVVLYMLYTNSFNPFAPWEGTEADRYSDPNAGPWSESHLFINKALDGVEMGGRRPPFPDQPKVNETIRYLTNVIDSNGNECGEIRIRLYKDGHASVIWQGEFKRSDGNYEIPDSDNLNDKNIFKGNFAPLKIYEDENGQDRSKLYFLTEGEFKLYEGRKSENISGSVYVSGWINDDYSSFGKLWVTSISGGQTEELTWQCDEPVEGGL